MFETEKPKSVVSKADMLDNSLGTTTGSHDPLAQDSAGTTAEGLKTSAPGEPLEEAKVAKPVIHSYPWYISDWKNSDTRLDFSMAERALYRELLDHFYAEGSIPTDERKLAIIAACPEREFAKLWPAVRQKFSLRSGRYIHKKASEIREKVIVWHDQRREAGRVGGLAKAKAGAKAAAVAPAKRTPQQPSSGRSSHPLPPPSSTTTSTGEEPPTPLRSEPAVMTPAIAVASGHGWEEFIGVYLSAGKKLNEQDLANGLREWISLDMSDQVAAFRHLQAEAVGNEARFLKFPANYLRARPWTRVGPERILPMQKRTRVDDAQDEALRIFEARQKEGMF